MSVTIRPAQPEDAAECGRICHDAFAAIAGAHGFPGDFPSVEIAQGLMGWLIEAAGVYGVVAERDGRIIGSNFMDERAVVRGIGPITIDPAAQNAGIGRVLMQHVLDRASGQRAAGVRLVQAGYHNRSMSLYTALGFRTQEPLSCLQGPALRRNLAGFAVRPATLADTPACEALCRAVHGFDRGAELRVAIGQGSAAVVEHQGVITGYATAIAFFGHAVGRSNEDVMALIGAASEFVTSE